MTSNRLPPLTDPAGPPAWAMKVEAAHAASARAWAEGAMADDPDSGAAVEPVAGGVVVEGGSASGPNVSRAWGLGMNGPVTEADLDRVEAFYARTGRAAQVAICPFADPSLPALVRARGYRFFRIDAAFAVDLDGWQPATGASASDVSVRVVDAEDAAIWEDTARDAFELGDVEPERFERMNRAWFRPPAVAFVAERDREPVGVAALTTFDGVAILMAAGTLPSARGQGVQRALLEARLRRAHADGAKLAYACAQTTGTSARNIVRAGLAPLYHLVIVERPTPS